MLDGKRFYFGQNLAEAEEMFGMLAKQHPPEIARHVPQQKIIETSELILTFDAGRLMRMEFLQDFNFDRPLTPYADDWKNLEGMRFEKEMTRAEASVHLLTWEKRAQALGASSIESGNDLSSSEYSLWSSDEDEDLKTLSLDWNVLGINLGKSRRAEGGGLWMDGWIINFASARDAELHQASPGIFRSVSAFCDEFNTAARR